MPLLKRDLSGQAINPGAKRRRRVAALAMKRGKSVDFTGYWQRHVAD
jgi:hypothetical protein